METHSYRRVLLCVAFFTLFLAGTQAQTTDSVRLAAIPRGLFWENSPIHFEAEKEGAIVLKADSLNWIKFCFEKDYTGQKRVVSVVTKGISDDCNSAASTANTIYYKIAKAGNVITLYYSAEGRNWFLAQSPTGQHCTVLFSDIHYSTRKIGDPYLGE
jgi:hypothetical protein